MKKIMFLIFCTVLAAYAQQDQEAVRQKSPESELLNTITIDLGPMIIGLGVGIPMDVVGEGELGEDFDAFGFGIAVQYERQIRDRVSVSWKFAYLGFDMGLKTEDEDEKIDDEASIYSFSLEVHPRFYPFNGNFFLDGMLGYANMAMKFRGEEITEEDGKIEEDRARFAVSRSYLKYGAKFGWRIDFGDPGGFVLEHSYGFYGAGGLGETMGKKISKQMDDELPEDFDYICSIVENFAFIGGPRATLAIGWRF